MATGSSDGSPTAPWLLQHQRAKQENPHAAGPQRIAPESSPERSTTGKSLSEELFHLPFCTATIHKYSYIYGL